MIIEHVETQDIKTKDLQVIQQFYKENYIPALKTVQYNIVDRENTPITMLELKMVFPFIGVNANGQNFTSLTEENYQKILSKIGDVMAEYLGYIDFITPEQAAKSNLPDFDNKGVLIHQGE